MLFRTQSAKPISFRWPSKLEQTIKLSTCSNVFPIKPSTPHRISRRRLKVWVWETLDGLPNSRRRTVFLRIQSSRNRAILNSGWPISNLLDHFANGSWECPLKLLHATHPAFYSSFV